MNMYIVIASSRSCAVTIVPPGGAYTSKSGVLVVGTPVTTPLVPEHFSVAYRAATVMPGFACTDRKGVCICTCTKSNALSAFT